MVGQKAAQLAAAAVESGHDRSYGGVHDLGNLLVGETLDVGEVDRQAPVLAQLVEGRLDLLVGQ